MPLDLTDVWADVRNIQRNLLMNENLTAVFMNMGTTLLTLNKDWYLSKGKWGTSADGNKVLIHDMKIADVTDSIDIPAIVPMTTSIVIEGTKYKVHDYFRKNKGATRNWIVQIYETGE